MHDNITTPTRLDDYIGQEDLKRKLRVYIEHSRKEVAPLPHMLFASSPGCGKTTLAKAIATDIGDSMAVVDLSKLKSDTLAYFLGHEFKGGIILFDEVHKATKKQQDDLLTLMEEGYISTKYGSRIEVGWLTCILATTEKQMLNAALVRRCLFRPTWARYSDEELTTIVEQMTPDESKMPHELAVALGRAAAGTPSGARDMVEAYLALGGNGEVAVADVLDMVGVDAEGLSNEHTEYLTALHKLGGVGGVDRIAMMTSSHPSVLKILERVLLDRNMIQLTGQGRVLLPAGQAKIGEGRRPYTRAS